MNRCRVCHTESCKKSRLKHIEHCNEVCRIYRDNNKEKIRKHFKDTYIPKPKHIQYQWPPPIEKRCTKCGEVKPVELFVKSSKTKHGIGSNCKECVKLNSKKNRIKNQKVKIELCPKLSKSEKSRIYRQNNQSQGEVNRCKARAKKYNAIHYNHNPKIELVLHDVRYRVQKCLGIDYIIDYILPLEKGGYNHHMNLQVIPKSLQSKKASSLSYTHPSLTHWTELPEFLISHIKNLEITVDEMSGKIFCPKCSTFKYKDEFFLKYKNSSELHSRCKLCMYNATHDWRQKNVEHITQYTKTYNKMNSDKLLARGRDYKKNNKSKVQASIKAWNNKNKHLKILYQNKRQTIKTSAYHPNHNPNIEKTFLLMSKRLSECLHVPYNVDHILPLDCGGYHHHGNLQVISARLNFSKKNRLNFHHPLLTHWTDLPIFLIDKIKL